MRAATTVVKTVSVLLLCCCLYVCVAGDDSAAQVSSRCRSLPRDTLELSAAFWVYFFSFVSFRAGVHWPAPTIERLPVKRGLSERVIYAKNRKKKMLINIQFGTVRFLYVIFGQTDIYNLKSGVRIVSSIDCFEVDTKHGK